MRRRWAGLAIMAAALLAGLVWWKSPGRSASAATQPATAAASAAAGVIPPMARQAASGNPALPAGSGTNTAREDARAELARRMKADWCGFGAAEHARQTDAIFEKAGEKTGSIGMEAIEEAQRTVGAELLKQAGDEAARRWSRQLMQRGDPRSQALADYLDGSNEARVRLQARARTSSDPLVTVLAMQRPCEPGTCINIEASQWSRLEPANVQAWLTVLNRNAGTGHTQVGYVLDRVATEARYSRNYRREFTDMLLSVAVTETPGLQNDAEAQAMFGTVAAWPIQSIAPMMHACREGLAQSGVAARCEALASTMWQQGDLLERSQALAVARVALSVRPNGRAEWEPRAREVEALKEWTKGEMERVMARFMPEGKDPAPCTVQAESWHVLREWARATDWERAREQMQAAKVDEAALAAAWRKQEGRSALDAPRPASAAAR